MGGREEERQGEPSRPGTPPRPPYSPVTPVFAHLQPIPGGATIVPPPAADGDGLIHSHTQDVAGGSMYVQNPGYVTHQLQQHQQQTTQRRGAGGKHYTQQQQQQQQQRPPQPPQLQQPPRQPPTYVSEPPPVPISESDNPDVIALRSAISILQIQKQQALKDIRTLDHLKQLADKDPEWFAREILASREDNNGSTDGLPDLSNIGFGGADAEVEEEDEEEEEEEKEGAENQKQDGGKDISPSSLKGKIPKPQNVVRMPPINWAKYQIVGEPLDKMHQEQLLRPSSGEPRPYDYDTTQQPRQQQLPQQRAPEHVLAAPYRPLVDKLESPVKSKGGAKKDKK